MKRKILLLLSLCAFVFVSCEKSEVSVADESSLTATAEASISELGVLAASDDALTTTSDEKARKGHKKKSKYTEVSVGSLPAAINTYISSNYADASVKRAAQNDSGYYKVHLVLADSSHVVLKFDPDGNFVKAYTHKTFTTVDITNLPEAISSYITANYTGATVNSAKLSSSGKYLVKITKEDSTTAVLGFESNGSFISEVTPKGHCNFTVIDVATLSETIITYISTNYPGSTITSAKTSDSGNYYVTVNLADATITVLKFDSTGTFVSVEKTKNGGGKGKH